MTFVANRIDDRTESKRGPPIPELLLLAATWTAWCLVHSLLILPAFMDWLQRHAPRYWRYHRLVYNGFAAVSLVPVAIYDRSLRGTPLLAWGGPWRLIQLALVAGACALFVLGSRGHDLRRFLGLTRPAASGALDTTGILGHVRHPWYLGGLLLIWATDLDPAVLVRNIILTVYLIAGAFWEEHKLVAEFGDAYRQYQRRVPMFLPRPWPRRRSAEKDPDA